MESKLRLYMGQLMLQEVGIKLGKWCWFSKRKELQIGRTGTVPKFVSSTKYICELILS